MERATVCGTHLACSMASKQSLRVPARVVNKPHGNVFGYVEEENKGEWSLPLTIHAGVGSERYR